MGETYLSVCKGDSSQTQVVHRCFFFLFFSAPAKLKKPKLLNKFDKTIKAEIDAAEKLRRKVTIDGAEQVFFPCETLKWGVAVLSSLLISC